MAQETKYNSGTIEDIIFENRNKAYGAYDIRMKYLNYVIIGFACALFFALVVTGTPYIVRLLHPYKDVPIENNEPVQGNLTEPPPTNKELPPPPEVKLPEPEQIKFVPPKIVEVVKKEEKLATVEEVKQSANVGDVTKEGTKDVITEPIKDLPVEDDKVYDIVSIEKMPGFPGGDDALLAFISNHVNYPQQALDNNIQGKVVVAFVVGKDGKVSDVHVKKGIKPADLGCNAEAERVVKLLPPFSPGMQNGKPVKVAYSVPITFKIK